MEELSGISYPETCRVSPSPACDSREHFSLGELRRHGIAWARQQQAAPAPLGTETSAWAQTASD